MPSPPLGVASQRDGRLHVDSVTEETTDPPYTGQRDTRLSLWPGLSPCTARPRGGGRRPKAGRWGRLRGGVRHPSVRGARCGARRDEHSQQTMIGEGRAGHGRLRSRTGREEQADATTGGSVVCRWSGQSTSWRTSAILLVVFCQDFISYSCLIILLLQQEWPIRPLSEKSNSLSGLSP